MHRRSATAALVRDVLKDDYLGLDIDRIEVVEDVAMAAIKFGELSHDRESAYVFDMDAFAQFEGKTGPYLQYSTVRLKTLLEKAAEAGLTPGEITVINDPARDLILTL